MADSSSATSRQLNIAVRLDILNKLEAGGNIKDLAREYNVTDRTIRRIRQNASSIRQFAEEESKLQRKRMRSSTSADLDKELYSWILERRTAGGRITDNILIEKAKAMQEETGGPSNFTASRGWLWRFKKNYNLSHANVHGECDDTTTDESAAKQFIQQLSQLQDDLEIGDDNLYNVDETSLLWRTLPKGIMISANEIGKRFRHRLLQRFSQYENGTSEFYADYDIKDCIDLVNEAWSTILSLNIFDSWGKILNRGTRLVGRNLAGSSSSGTASYETISDEEVTEWISQCEEAERIGEDAIEEAEESSHLQPPSPIEAEEIDRLLYYLRKITVTEPAIANHAESIIDYYNSK
ncbi:unnamed protein product [Heterotrigona itama]|uniref:HTH CENPB-type domain-containing protein n=1 Tax=Heterotrigona itama TaxID=395501 RepID=A0A6V7H4M2_9HYME|nr:unnamed protein product [Heterotrigona itama]